MIGKPEWFTYRVFGWGLAPKTWQGWAYVGIAAALLGGTFAAATISPPMRWVAGAALAILLLDVLHIMLQLPKVSDERENYHQLLIERNCSFAAILALVGVATYQAYRQQALLGTTNALPFDWTIAVVLGAMLATKIGSTVYVKLRL